MQSTGATIETSYAKDQSLTFVVIGILNIIQYLILLYFSVFNSFISNDLGRKQYFQNSAIVLQKRKINWLTNV